MVFGPSMEAQQPNTPPVPPVPAVLLPTKLPTNGPEKQLGMAQALGPLHSHRRPGRGSWFSVSDHTSDLLAIWEMNQQLDDLSIPPLFPLTLSSKTKK